MVPWHVGHTSGSTSKICRSNAAHRRGAAVGTSRAAVTSAAAGDAGDLAEQPSATQAIREKPLWDRQNNLPVRLGREERGVQPLGPDSEAFRVAAGTEAPALAGEREQVFVGTGVTSEARETVREDTAGEELGRDLSDDRAPRAVVAREALVGHRLQSVEVILHYPEQRRRLRAPGLVDAEARRRGGCPVPHAPQTRFRTKERRAYGRTARGLSSWCCVAGHYDASSECGPNAACCCRADHRLARSATFVGPLAAEAVVVPTSTHPGRDR